MKRPFILMSALASGALLAACQTPADQADAQPTGAAQFAGDPRLGEKTDRLCFASTVDGFRQAGDNTVILETGPSTEYLVETNGTCFDLDRAQTIGLDTDLSCARPGDSLIVSDSAFGLTDNIVIGPQRCLIRADLRLG